MDVLLHLIGTQRDWALGATVTLALVLLGLWLEYRVFHSRGKAASWMLVRMASLVAGLLAAMAVLLPTSAVSGMEGLAVFYALLLTVAPLIWLGAHLGVGRWLALTTGECVALAISGLVLLGLPAFATLLAWEPMQMAARHLQDNPPDAAPPPPLAHAVQPVQRLRFPQAGDVFAQSLLAPPGLRLERVDERMGDLWDDMTARDHPRFCREGNDLHLLWSAREGAPQLRLHWVGADGQRQVAPHSPGTAGTEAAPFETTFRPDGFTFPAPVPRTRVHFALALDAAGKPNHIAMGNSVQPGERDDGCVMPDYRRVKAAQEGPVIAVAVVVRHPDGVPRLEHFMRNSP